MAPSLASAPELPKNTLLMPVRLHSFFRQLAAGCSVVQVRGVLQFVCLLGHSFCPCKVAVAKAVHPDAAGEVQILLSLGALGVQPVAFFQHDGAAVIGVQDVLVVPLDDFFQNP